MSKIRIDEKGALDYELRQDFGNTWHHASVEYWVLAKTSEKFYKFIFSAPHLVSLSLELMLKQLIVQCDSTIKMINFSNRPDWKNEFLRTDKVFENERHNIQALINRWNGLNVSPRFMRAQIEPRWQIQENGDILFSSSAFEAIELAGSRQFNGRYPEFPKTITVPDVLDLIYYHLWNKSKYLLKIKCDRLDTYIENTHQLPEFNVKSLIINNQGFYQKRPGL